MRGRVRDALLVAAVALAVRLAVILPLFRLFPASQDGFYFDVLARRLAEGAGYTWLWPDGVVTYASHYPVGYPFLLSLAYRVSPSVLSAMLLNALFGALGAAALPLSLREASRKRALVAGLVVALHPALVPYTLAVMTEGVTTALLCLSFAFGIEYRTRSRTMPLVLAAVTMGLATLVRPQCLLLAPLLGFVCTPREPRAPAALFAGRRGLVSSPVWRHLRTAAALTSLALAVCAPWTVRNCLRTDRCSLVSANGGWNLLIGAETQRGAWEEVKVPEECKEVFAEGAKDSCFGAAGRRRIASAPLAFLSRVPSKLAVTFDYFGAAPWYLHATNPEAFGERSKVALGAVETVVARLLLIAALVTSSLSKGPRAGSRRVVGAFGVLAACSRHGALGYLLLVLVAALFGRELSRRPTLAWTAGLIAITAFTHAVFFGAGRYGLVVVPFVSALAVLDFRGAGSGDEDGADAPGLGDLAG